MRQANSRLATAGHRPTPKEKGPQALPPEAPPRLVARMQSPCLTLHPASPQARPSHLLRQRGWSLKIFTAVHPENLRDPGRKGALHGVVAPCHRDVVTILRKRLRILEEMCGQYTESGRAMSPEP